MLDTLRVYWTLVELKTSGKMRISIRDLYTQGFFQLPEDHLIFFLIRESMADTHHNTGNTHPPGNLDLPWLIILLKAELQAFLLLSHSKGKLCCHPPA